MAREKEPVARMAKLLEYGKTVSGHNWYKFFDLWLDAILLSLKPPTTQEWQEFLERNCLEKSEETMTEAFSVLAQQAQQDNRDYLGPLYELLAVNDKHYFGQFFTPWEVALVMAGLNLVNLPAPDLYRAEPYTICDPCVGSGTLLLAMAEVVQERDPIGFSLGHYQFYGQDKDGTCVRMAKINMRLHNLNRPFVRFCELSEPQQLLTLMLQAGYRPPTAA